MSLYKYALSCSQIAEELKEHLTGDEYEDVFDAIGQFSIAEWYAWREEHASSVRLLATATPAKQKKLLGGAREKKKHLRLVFAACQYCLENSEILTAFDGHCQPGRSYRDMIGSAYDALEQIQNRDNSFWPWGGWPTYRDFPTQSEYAARANKKDD